MRTSAGQVTPTSPNTTIATWSAATLMPFFSEPAAPGAEGEA
ncbi:hypothetical protein [Bradyrhizobium glycinis]|nr:hypothetical protein [Bradyrhizobium glycinis]